MPWGKARGGDWLGRAVNADTRGFQTEPSARSAVLVLAASLALAAGCAQEGRLIDTPLRVNGVSSDRVLVHERVAIDTTTSPATITVYDTLDVNFKISVHAASPCEARRGLLELRRVGQGAAAIFILRPVARYNLDDACTALGVVESDTVLTLSVTGISLVNNQVERFQIETANGPAIESDVDSTIHASTPATIRFEVRVESQSSGAAIAGAAVTLEQLGGGAPTLLGSGLSDGNGFYGQDVSSGAAVGVAALPYRVTVTYGPDTRVMSVPGFPARGQSRERVVVRL